MLHGISWAEFFGVLGIAVGLYYVALFLIYSKRKAGIDPHPADVITQQNAATTKRFWNVSDTSEQLLEEDEHHNNGLATEQEPEVISQTEERPYEDEDKLFDSLELLAANIQAIITNAEPGAQKQDLLQAVAAEIAKHPELTHIAFQNAINNLIIKQAEQYCNISINKDELEKYWPSVFGHPSEEHQNETTEQNQ